MIERLIKFAGWVIHDLLLISLAVCLGMLAYAKAPEFFRALATISLCVIVSGFILIWIWARWDQSGE